MALKYLGSTFDIHGGGIDNIFPHNESEIAQSECANDAEFARYWMLVGSLTVDGIKMSKSLGNFITIADALKHYRPEVIRMFMESVHYSSPVDYSADALDGAARGWERIANAVRLVRRAMNTAPESGGDGNGFMERVEKTRTDFAAAMDDDFNMPIAIAALQGLTRDANSLLNSGTAVSLDLLKAINDTYTTLGSDILGIVPADEGETGGSAQREAALVELLINMRAQARANKNYAESDRIRDELAKIGVILEDRADGTVWKVE
ncbi:MAG: class I tRNA ligase family protein [Acidobacteriales bacterium]|nr:class I tRNA ligase family protein [Terriglobales bacterium]